VFGSHPKNEVEHYLLAMLVIVFISYQGMQYCVHAMTIVTMLGLTL
jgi:hypothetical protein